ncbi:MAG TPA: cytochrome c3 family protein, partial [Longimicrobiales bacterium]
MTARNAVLLVLVGLAGAGRVSAAAPAASAAFKLKPGAEGKLCLDCHPQFEEVLKKPFVHTPVRSRQCSGCHNPHASNHGKFLEAEGAAVCTKCHATVVPAQAKSQHKPVADGKCTQCHDPHAAAAKNNLLKPGNDLCATCHQKVVAAAAGSRFQHKPVAQGCTACHDPHGSAKAPSLLQAEVPGLCLGCHKADRQVFVKAHLGYPVAKARCTSCHDPHGSNNRGLLYNTVHPPVAKGGCPQCHEPATAPNALKTKSPPPQLCRGCHSAQFN